MAKLSVIIVNYNVMHFLEQCLNSVRTAGNGLEYEVFVVDNNSVDGSRPMLREKFPEVRLINNSENVGFSRANNQAIREARGEYILLLNPDTVVEDSTFSRCVSYMDAHPEAGGLGVKMVDGKGHFLPESKRGLPTPAVAFYKIVGLSALFPRSRMFGKYHLGYLDKDQVHEVDVLSGAFMMLRKSALDQVGLLDEDFFMYGEDIDLSYRITLGGYKNIYFPETRIIHYKGESTKKSSINYVFVFYNAMVIFARKHFSKKNAGLFSFMIKTAVWLRAFIAIMARAIKRIFLPLLDALLIFTGIYFFTGYWEQHVIFPDGGEYPMQFIFIVLPVYIFVWLFAVLVSGGYDRPIRLARIVLGLFWGTVVILSAYALLSESMRFSRALIIIGAGWAMISMLITRLLLRFSRSKSFALDTRGMKRFVVVGGEDEARRVADLLRNTQLEAGYIGLVGLDDAEGSRRDFIGNIDQLPDILKIYDIGEVVFCSKDLPPQRIITLMSELSSTNIEFKIAPPESLTIIGSNSINTAGDLFVLNINNINKPENRRSKLLFDLLFSLLLLILSPILLFIVKRPLGLLMNIVKVMGGAASWVGYAPETNGTVHLPALRKGVLNTSDVIDSQRISPEIRERLNLLYAKDYRIRTDLNIMWKGLRELGRRVA